MTIRDRTYTSVERGKTACLGTALFPLVLTLVLFVFAASTMPFAHQAYATAADTSQEANTAEGAVTLTTSRIMATNNASATSDPNEVVGVYAGFPSRTSSSEDLLNLFYYSDSLFANPASVYNDDLAYASVNLAAAASNSNTGGDNYPQKACNIVSLLEDIGCSDVQVNAGYTDKPGEQSNIGVAIGHKLIQVNGQAYRLFVVGVRGGGYEAEWISNVKVGDGQSTGGDHQGLQESRDATLGFILPYMRDHVQPGEHVKVWASGYSRGGAVLNMACAWLDKWIYERNGNTKADGETFGPLAHDGGSYDPNSVFCDGSYDKDEQHFTSPVSFEPNGADAFIDESVSFSEEDVYCYAVNDPQGANKADVEACRNNRLTVGMHNLINPDDWFSQLCPYWEGWSFARYGTDHDITCTYAQDRSAAMGDSFAKREKSILGTNPNGAAAAIERLKEINPAASYVSLQFRQYFFAKASVSIKLDEKGKGNVFVSQGAEMKYNQGEYFGEITQFFFKAAGCNNRSQYATKLQEDAMYLSGLMVGAPRYKRDQMVSIAKKHAMAALEAETGRSFDTILGKLAIVTSIDDWMADGESGKAAVPKKLVKATLVNTLEELDIAYDEAKIDKAAGTIAEIAKSMYKEEQAISSFNFYHLSTIYKAGLSISQAHWPEVSVAWWPEARKKNVVRVTGMTTGASMLLGEGVYATGEKAKLTAQAASGYEFAGWYENGVKVADTAEWTFTVNGSRQIEARWSKQNEVGKSYNVSGSTYKVTSNTANKRTVTLTKAKAVKAGKSFTVAASVKINGTTYKVTAIGAKAFNKSKAANIIVGKNVSAIEAKSFSGAQKAKTITLGTGVAKIAAKAFTTNKALRTLVVKTKKLKKTKVSNSLKGSKVTTVMVQVGTKAQNKKYVEKYKKVFAKKTCGKEVTVK